MSIPGLFQTPGLYNDIGDLKERWGQDGSTIKNFHFATDADTAVYTVTAGKRLYINFMMISESGSSGAGDLNDGGAGGTVKITFHNDSAVSGTIIANLSTPIYFDTDIYYNETLGCTGFMTLTGWEEESP
jgi:hypothetical protein